MATFDLGRVTPLYKGDYSASTSYELNDVVLYNGSLYWHVQATATVGISPTDTTVWKLAFSDEGVRAEIRGYADDAQQSADSALASKSAAATSASNASASASSAQASASQAASSAQSAQSAETGATASAQTANSKASEASASAQSAAASVQTATDNATLASQKAAAASESATLATAKASAAATSETNAAASAQTATAKATEATTAAATAVTAKDDAVSANTAAQSAKTAAQTAQTGAETAAASVEASAEQIATNTEDIGELKSDLYQKTDNLIRFDDTSFWERKDLDGTSRTYAATTADFIPVIGGAELYTALKDLDTDIFGTVFNIHVRQYDSENNVVVSDTTYSAIGVSAPTHHTLNASTTKIKVMLTTNNWQKTFTLDQLKALNPLIYVGFNSSITNATIYRMYAPKVSFFEEEYTTFSQSVNASIGTINYGDFEYQADRYISGNGNIVTDTSTQHAVLIKGLEANEGDEFVVYCETPRPSQPHLAYCAYSSITDLRAVTAIGSRVATTDIFLDTGKTYIVKIEFTVPSGAKTVAISFRTYNNAKWIILRKSDDPLKNSQVLNIYNILMDAYSRTVSNELIENVSNTRAINHRGYNSIAPENTLPAFKLSRKKGFKYVETDVRFTSDGVAVLLHDDTINRTARNADGTELPSDVYINAITYEQALTYDFGIWKSSDYAETRIPTFEQFVALCRNIGVSAYVEIKAGTQAQVESLVDIAVKYGMDKHITWNSFDVPWLEYVKNYKPNARIGLLANTIDSSIITSANGLKTNSNEVFINASISTITEANVALAIANDLPIEAWTVYASNIPTLNPYVTGMTIDKGLLNNYMFNKNID